MKSDEACPTKTKEDDWNASTQMVTCDCLGECLLFNRLLSFTGLYICYLRMAGGTEEAWPDDDTHKHLRGFKAWLRVPLD